VEVRMAEAMEDDALEEAGEEHGAEDEQQRPPGFFLLIHGKLRLK